MTDRAPVATFGVKAAAMSLEISLREMRCSGKLLFFTATAFLDSPLHLNLFVNGLVDCLVDGGYHKPEEYARKRSG